MYKNVFAFIAGLLFGLGLAVSQMVNPEKVIAFLDIAGAWDPSLLLVMVAAVAVNFIGFRLTTRRSRPLFGDVFHLPTRIDLDTKLIIGAAIFGVGWGLGGYCPGPALAALSIGSWEPLVFVAAMLLGSLGYQFFERSPPKLHNNPNARARIGE
ncbi:MAG: DUF6691 family protein [Pseudomonadales bacterium]